MEKYVFWEATTSQIGGGGLDKAIMTNSVSRLVGAVSLQLQELSKYGIPIGLHYGGGDAEIKHVGEQTIEWGDEQIYGPNDNPVEDVSILEETKNVSVQVSPVIDSYVYDQLIQKVSPYKKRAKHPATKRRGLNK